MVNARDANTCVMLTVPFVIGVCSMTVELSETVAVPSATTNPFDEFTLIVNGMFAATTSDSASN